jgi:hypothetical protein
VRESLLPNETLLSPDRLSGLVGARVVTVEVDEIGTFSTSLSRVRLGYQGDPSGAPASLVLKRSVVGRTDRLGESFATEIRFYRELAHRIPARLPRFYDGGFDLQTGAGFLLMEDVTGIEPTDWRGGPSEEHARLAMAAMAGMHASFWHKTRELEWIPSFADPELLASFEDVYSRNWPEWRDFFVDIVPNIGALGDALVGHIAASHVGLAEEPTLLHGDAHAENMPLVPSGRPGAESREEVVLLDWAGPRRGNAGVDLGFFIPMSFSVARRREVEAMLVDHHHQVLSLNGVTPSVDPWLAYRRGVLRRITRIIGSAHTWDVEAFSALSWIFDRCARAAVELEVEEFVR